MASWHVRNCGYLLRARRDLGRPLTPETGALGQHSTWLQSQPASLATIQIGITLIGIFEPEPMAKPHWPRPWGYASPR